MHDVLKERVWRRLQALPQEQLYQVLDYIEFLEARYAKEQAVKADPIQKFAERLEDGMRMRSVGPRVISGTVGLLGTARKVVRSVSDAGRDLLEGASAAVSGPADPPRPPRPPGAPPAGTSAPPGPDAPGARAAAPTAPTGTPAAPMSPEETNGGP